MEKPKDSKYETAECVFCGTRKKWKNLIKAVTHPTAKPRYACVDYEWCDKKVEKCNQV
jgi:hypothetical protein